MRPTALLASEAAPPIASMPSDATTPAPAFTSNVRATRRDTPETLGRKPGLGRKPSLGRKQVSDAPASGRGLVQLGKLLDVLDPRVECRSDAVVPDRLSGT